jgi:hypothetical protein
MWLSLFAKIEDYRTSDLDLLVPIVEQAMTCDRYFQAPCKFFCNIDSMPHSNRDKVFKSRPVIGSPNRKFQEL